MSVKGFRPPVREKRSAGKLADDDQRIKAGWRARRRSAVGKKRPEMMKTGPWPPLPARGKVALTVSSAGEDAEVGAVVVGLAARLGVPRLTRPAGGGPLHLAIDATGLKVHGEGEWKVRTHGKDRRRSGASCTSAWTAPPANYASLAYFPQPKRTRLSAGALDIWYKTGFVPAFTTF